jgi:hypothetical protein
MKRIFAGVLLLAISALTFAAENNDGAKTTKAAPKAAAAKSQKFDGWVSDEKCGAKVDAACAKKCEAAGAKMVFVDPDKNVIPVSNPETLKGLGGQHVTIRGKLDNGTLAVVSVKATPEPPAKTDR